MILNYYLFKADLLYYFYGGKALKENVNIEIPFDSVFRMGNSNILIVEWSWFR